MISHQLVWFFSQYTLEIAGFLLFVSAPLFSLRELEKTDELIIWNLFRIHCCQFNCLSAIPLKYSSIFLHLKLWTPTFCFFVSVPSPAFIISSTYNNTKDPFTLFSRIYRLRWASHLRDNSCIRDTQSVSTISQCNVERFHMTSRRPYWRPREWKHSITEWTLA